MTKTYTLTCPNPDCEHQFTHEADPAVLDAGDFPLIVCPVCEEEWEAEYDTAADTLELWPDDDEEIEEDDEDGDEDGDDEDSPQ